jgi:rfaE bifunctional protein kinase chain/domain
MSLRPERARELLAAFPRQRILVIGDLMLDRYIYGAVNRISPEAPVPVVSVTHEKSMPGGASNTAWNVQSLGGQAVVGGVLGKDAAGADLKALLSGGGVGLEGLVEGEGFRTTVKTRIIAERQQVVRVDWDDHFDVGDRQARAFGELMSREARRATGIILEDYGKGVVRQPVVDAVLKVAREAAIPVGLDPKEGQELDVRGITLATPNRHEAFSLAGVRETRSQAHPLEDQPLLDVSARLLEKWNAEQILVTLGSQGILLRARAGGLHHVPTRAREVFDVSGAGDTVIATCVLALAAGATPIEAAELANYAAGVVVGKLGTATCTPEELTTYMGGGESE